MKMNKHTWIVASLLAVATLQAQEIKVKDKIVEKSDGTLLIGMTLDFGETKVPSDRSLICTPVITSGDSIRPLTPVILSGRDRHILYERTERTYTTHDEYELRREKGKPQTFEYTTRTPMAPWMKKSEVALVIDECGCGWEALQNDRLPLFPINMAEPVVLKPLLAYRTPEAEAVKARSIEGKAFLDFPVNKITIYPDYRNNPRELAAIRATIESVKDDPYATITEVWIKGFASPEGTYANNTYLAENRAKALRDYVKSLYRFEHATFSVDFEPEDWEGLEKRLEEMNLPDKAELLAIIRNPEPRDMDKKELKLKTLNGGTSYKILLRDIYPALRHSDYVVKYHIRNFTAEEAKSLIYTDPKKLSLNEMFMVAQLFEAGSEKYNEVFEIAVRMFPDDPVSNLNAANTAIRTGQLDRAESYLAKAVEGDEKQLALASVRMLRGDLDGAEAILKRLENSPAAGEAARANLEQIKAKREE
ncbi:DUF3868 domain-containing protein [uncultured Parabacteroides sp.]|jgi:outer membrane protein OmpA-like peptidoglycan-associated protein|uniref:DUF3868 domain-containing protein n=1 Tax=uncultured Parabacteroides sp. TaxID=512312 RepID=UPI0025DCB188|nr:DUF3868 domain-containing protein [uncultured Parabacteroides sp.]